MVYSKDGVGIIEDDPTSSYIARKQGNVQNKTEQERMRARQKSIQEPI